MIISSFGRRLLAAANGTFAGTIIGLGTAAFKNTGTSGNTVPLLDGVNTWSGIQTFSANPSVTGGAISFPATQVPSAGANDLDDYEEGTWTPGITFGGGATGVTYSFQTGRYTKIGRQVTVLGRFALTAKGSSIGNAAITGLPFTVTSAIQAAGSMARYASLAGLTGAPIVWAELSTTTIILAQTGAGSFANITDANFTNTSDIMFYCSYIV